MHKAKITVVLAAITLFLAALPLLAHHPFTAEFDPNKPLSLTGKVTSVDWTNPHTYFHVDVKDANGKVERWKFEGASPSALTHQGWKRSSVKKGDEITVKAYQARDGSKVASVRELMLANGKKLAAVDPKDGGPKS